MSETSGAAPADGNAVTDPMQLGYSLANVRELLLSCLDAAEVRSVLEIGSFEGELTEFLLDWAADRDAVVGGSTRCRRTSFASSPRGDRSWS